MNGVVCEVVGGVYYLLSFVFSSFEGVCDDLPETAVTVVRTVASAATDDPSSWTLW